MSQQAPSVVPMGHVVEGVSGALYPAQEALQRFSICPRCHLAVDQGPVGPGGTCQWCEPASPPDGQMALPEA